MTYDATKNESASNKHPGFLKKYRLKIAVAFLLTSASGLLVDMVGYLGFFVCLPGISTKRKKVER